MTEEIVEPGQLQKPPQKQGAVSNAGSSPEPSYSSDGSALICKRINSVNADKNKADLEKRRQEVQSGGLKEFYKGDMLGMQIFEGDVDLRDRREASEKIIRLRVRMFVGRNLPLPTMISPQHNEYSKTNDNLLATLYYEASSQVLDGFTVLMPPQEAKGKYYEDSNNAMIALVEKYREINKDQDRYPLTLIYAHGDVDDVVGEHVTSSSDVELYPTNMVLNTLLENFPKPEGVDKIPTLLAQCNESDSSESVTIKHPQMVIGYRSGLGGYLSATGHGALSE